jgi:hypothetical protein
MNQGVNQQVATCIHVEEVAIDHMGDPRKRMPVSLVKSRECPSESRKRNAAIHHWIILDIPTIIESDELVPNHLRINPKGHYREPEKNEEIGSPEWRRVADGERFRGSTIGRGGSISLSLLRSSFAHADCEATRPRTVGQSTS